MTNPTASAPVNVASVKDPDRLEGLSAADLLETATEILSRR